MMTEKILVVDDNVNILKFVSILLRKAGYEIVEACDGQEALERAFESMPDLILLDIMMPKLNGYEVCAILKKDDRTADIPMIFLSAKSETEDKIKGLDIGGADYVTKPVNKGELLARVRSQLRIRSLTKELIHANKELIEKQKRLDEDLKAAAGIQRSLLPQKLPEMENLEIAWKFLPCDLIGGDVFNVVRLDGNHIGIYMLDVSGHGVPAALVTVSVSQMLQPHTGYMMERKTSPSLSYEIFSPREVFNTLDQEYPIERFDKFFTIVYLILNVHKGTLKYSNAAHPPPVLLRSDGSLELLDKGGTIIGLGGRIPFEEEQKELQSGDKIILYTDGVVEYQNDSGHFFGKDRFYTLLKNQKGHSISKILDEVLKSLIDFSSNTRPQDDVSLLGIEFK